MLLTAQAAATGPGATRLTAASGVEVWLVPVERAATFTLRLAVGEGLGAEDASTTGAAASVAAWLRVGPTPSHAPRALAGEAARAGLTLATELGWYDTSLVLSGPAAAIEIAGWLAVQRLRAPPDFELPVELLSGALWLGDERARAESVGFHGDAVEEVMAEALGGDAGHTPTGSRRGAERFSPQRLEEHARIAVAGPARLVVAGPPAALERLRGPLLRALDTLSLRPARPEQRMGLTAEVRRARPPAVALKNPSDLRHHVVVAWDLRGAARRASLDIIGRDAALASLEVLLGHPGAPLATRLVRDEPVARSVRARARDMGGDSVAVIAEVRASDAGRARELLLEEAEAVGRPGGLPHAVIVGAGRLAAHRLAARWGTSAGRAALLAEIVASGRDARAPVDWFGRLLAALDPVDVDAVRDLASWGLVSSRRTLANVTPERPASQLPPGLADDLLETYLRITVDLRCPPRGVTPDAATLLREKYEMQPRTYVILTRALARRPNAMQSLGRAAAERCLEYAKLRGLLPAERIIELHEAVACGPGRLPETAGGLRALARIHKQFDIDASWYRPLVAMLREDTRNQDALEAIDLRCPDPSVPGAP